jgi:hypothetical protein
MPIDNLPADVRMTAAALAHPQPMRRGSLGERFMKCGKAACACHTNPDARHGPYVSLTRGVAHTTRSRFLTRAQAEVARTQVARAGAFRDQLERYWQACERWADTELEAATGETEAAKKGASHAPSRPRSPRRSTRS